MPLMKPQTPVIFLAFANEMTDQGFLRGLSIELKKILRTLEPAVQAQRCHVKILPAATQEEIVEVFQDEWYRDRIMIFHYGGHAAENQLWLEGQDGDNQAFFSQGLARFLGAQSGLKLVFLNGCATGEHAQLLHASKIPAVITTSRKISDEQAQDFASVFYGGIASGGTVKEAFGEAEGVMLGKYPSSEFDTSGLTRSLFWDEPVGGDRQLDFPWRISFVESEKELHENWRLFIQHSSVFLHDQPKPEAFIGEVINNMRLEKVLGAGSVGTVFKAIHLNLNEERAIKITHRITEGYEQLKQVVYSGNKGLSSIQHPNVVKFYDVGEVVILGEKRLYVAMELVKGERLDKIPPSNWLGSKESHATLSNIMLQITEGLDAAHRAEFTDLSGMPRQGIVHGNIKSRKILFTTEGVPKLIDFLFTDLSRSQNIKIEIPNRVREDLKGERIQDFIAPEIISGKTGVTKAGDIYSLGAVFFNMLTGKSIGDFNFKSDQDLHKFVKQQDQLFPIYLSKLIFEASRPNAHERTKQLQDIVDQLIEHENIIRRTTHWFRRLFN